MSLDVYLELPSHTCPTCNCEHGGGTVYEANITHNLGRMASEAGLYDALWRPEFVVAGPVIASQIRLHENEQRWREAKTLAARYTAHARDLITRLRDGLAKLRADPERYQKLNPENKWGNYDGLVKFTEAYLAACEANPGATVRVCR